MESWNGVLGQRVRARRAELKLSQEKLAHKSGLHWTFISQVERGVRGISVANLLKLADGLDTTPGALLDGLHASLD